MATGFMMRRLATRWLTAALIASATTAVADPVPASPANIDIAEEAASFTLVADTPGGDPGALNVVVRPGSVATTNACLTPLTEATTTEPTLEIHATETDAAGVSREWQATFVVRCDAVPVSLTFDDMAAGAWYSATTSLTDSDNFGMWTTPPLRTNATLAGVRDLPFPHALSPWDGFAGTDAMLAH